MRLSSSKIKILKICAVSLLAVFVAVVVLFAAVSTKDAFAADFNGGSHDFDTDAWMSDSEGLSFFQSADQGKNGSSCLGITTEATNDARFVRDLYLQARRTYQVTGYIRVPESVTGSKAAGASIQIQGVNSSGSVVVNEKSQYVKNSGDNWIKVQFRIPETSMSYDYKILLRLGDNSADTAGTAYFDDITVRMVSPLNEGTYENMRIVSCLIVLGALFIFYLVYKSEMNKPEAELLNASNASSKANASGKGKTKNKKKSKAITAALSEDGQNGASKFVTSVVALFAVAFFVRIFLSIMYFQCDIDVNLFKSWADHAVSGGIKEIYNNLGSNIDYPPLYVFFLYAASAINGAVGQLFGLGQEYFYTVIIKMPSMLCDLAIGYIIFKYLRKSRASEGMSLLFTAAWLFNPLSLLDSACWGQVDSMLTFLVVMSIIFLNKNDFLTGGIFFGLGIMLKPQMMFFLPVFGYVWLRKVLSSSKYMSAGENVLDALKNFGLSIGGALIGIIVPYIPFLHMGMVDVKGMKLPWIFSLYIGTADHYEYATVNCYNFWFLLGKNWVKDSEILGGLSISTWGLAAIVAVSLITLVFALLLKEGEHVPYLLAAFMYAAVPFFAHRMHERYFFPALALLIIAAVISNNKATFVAAGTISVTGFLSVSDIMMGLLVGGNLKKLGNDNYGSYYWPALDTYRKWIAIIMLAAIVMILLIMAVQCLKKKNPLRSNTMTKLFEPDKQSGVKPVLKKENTEGGAQ